MPNPEEGHAHTATSGHGGSPQLSSPRRLQTRRERLDHHHKRNYQGRRVPATVVSRHRDDEEKKSDSSLSFNNTDDSHGSSQQQQDTNYGDLIRQPQHLTPPSKATTTRGNNNSEDNDDNYRYYRIIYRGVVALLSQPEQGSSRSGCYLSYGEVIKSGCQIQLPPSTSGENSSSESKDNEEDTGNANVTAIRVDQVLTGGYAFDPPDPSTLGNNSHSNTPKRSNINVQGYATAFTTTPATDGINTSPSVTISLSHSSSSDNNNPSDENDETDLSTQLHAAATSEYQPRCEHNGTSHQGFLLSHKRKNSNQIVQLLTRPPHCEHGKFFYKIISTTPLPILSGPSTDAPLSKAMVLPGTVHEVSFRLKLLSSTDNEDGGDNKDQGIWFLRLARRKGYLASCRLGGRSRSRSTTAETLVKDVTDEIHASGEISMEQHQHHQQQHYPSLSASSTADDRSTNVSVLSVLSTSVPSSTARNANRRHRPPRRRRDTDDKSDLRPMHHHATITASRRVHNNHNHHNDSTMTSISAAPSHSSDTGRLQTPSSNVSLLSDDSCLMVDPHHQHISFSSSQEHLTNQNTARFSGALSPDRSVARSIRSNHSFQQPQQHATYYLMRVKAPRGLRILDAPHFQVNNLIHGTTATTQQPQFNDGQHNLFHTMAGRIATSNQPGNTVVFDSVTKTRILPREAVFEASKRMETSEALFHQGAGLIKLADNSGWVIVPHQEELEHQYRSHDGSGGGHHHQNLRAFEEVGNAIVYGGEDVTDVWMRIVTRAGAHVACAPPPPPLNKSGDSSPTSNSSPTSSAVSAANTNNGSALDEPVDVAKSDSASDVASSVGSSFLDAMFRLPKRTETTDPTKDSEKGKDSAGGNVEKPPFTNNTIPCGICVQVEPQIPSDHHESAPPEYARLRGGQGWIPLFAGGKPTCVVCPRLDPPESRLGSFWFRVQSKRGIKVRLGPSKRAPSIKSSEGVYFRFECGEFLRASEVINIFYKDSQGRTLSESFAKLYRNRHVRLNEAKGESQSDYRPLTSLTSQAEWVQIHDDDKNELYLQECTSGPPRIERHKQGWRYQVIPSSGLAIRKGPSFEAEVLDIYVAESESVVIIERVTSAEENGVTWLRLKEGQGWLHDVERDTGERVLIPHSFRHRTKATNARPKKPPRQEGHDDKNKQIAYNTIIARLFHNDLPNDHQHRHHQG